MLNTSAMEDERRQLFFWLGVLVLPVFWSWFTLARSFAAWQRSIAFSWLGLWSLWLWLEREAVLGHLQQKAFAYPVVLGWMSIALGVWLFIRMLCHPRFHFRMTFVDVLPVLIIFDALSCVYPSTWFMDRLGKPFDWHWLLPLLGLALAHLVLDRLRRPAVGENTAAA